MPSFMMYAVCLRASRWSAAKWRAALLRVKFQLSIDFLALSSTIDSNFQFRMTLFIWTYFIKILLDIIKIFLWLSAHIEIEHVNIDNHIVPLSVVINAKFEYWYTRYCQPHCSHDLVKIGTTIATRYCEMLPLLSLWSMMWNSSQ